MEIFYQTKFGVYPFHRKMGSQTPSVEHLQPFASKEMATRIKQFGKIYKTIQCPHLIPLRRTLKEQQQFHMIYEYQDQSLSDFLPKHTHIEVKRIEKQLSCAFKCLLQAKVRVDIRIENITVTDDGSIKLFVMPDSEDPLNQQDLEQFYSTQKTRIHFELDQLWEQIHGKDENQTEKQQHSPGFIISGNKLMFVKNSAKGKVEKQQITHEETEEAQQNSNSHSDSAKNIQSVIERQKQIIEKMKAKKNSTTHKKQNPHQNQQKPQQIGTLPSAKDSQQSEGLKLAGLSKASSSNEDLNIMKKNPQRNSSGNVNIFRPIEDKMSNSTNPRSKENGKLQYNQERPISHYHQDKSQDNYKQHKSNHKNQDPHMVSHSRPEQKQKIKHSEQDKIQITTEMVSKYKMKIVTCQQIQFEGKQGQDLEKLAQEKLMEYRLQHGYPQTAIEQQKEEDYKEAIVHEIKAELQEEHRNSQQDEIMDKILKAKEKASTALKQYVKNKKK